MIEAISTCGVALGGNIENEIAPCTEILSILESKHNIFSYHRVHLAYKHGSNFNFKVRACRITFRLIFLIILKRAENLIENGNSFGFSLLKIMLQNILEKNYGGELYFVLKLPKNTICEKLRKSNDLEMKALVKCIQQFSGDIQIAKNDESWQTVNLQLLVNTMYPEGY